MALAPGRWSVDLRYGRAIDDDTDDECDRREEKMEMRGAGKAERVVVFQCVV